VKPFPCQKWNISENDNNNPLGWQRKDKSTNPRRKIMSEDVISFQACCCGGFFPTCHVEASLGIGEVTHDL